MSYTDFMALERPDDEPAPINLQSIADYSGIPRETVRRKLRDLEQLGWIVRRDNGYLVATTRAAQDLAPATEATLTYLAAIIAACNEAISD
jgi:DNA-binding GntR family transcriptional regulator